MRNYVTAEDLALAGASVLDGEGGPMWDDTESAEEWNAWRELAS